MRVFQFTEQPYPDAWNDHSGSLRVNLPNRRIDPVRAAEAIIKAVQADKPPFRLVLGHSAVQRIRAELDAQRRELDLWEETANAADYPA